MSILIKDKDESVNRWILEVMEIIAQKITDDSHENNMVLANKEQEL